VVHDKLTKFTKHWSVIIQLNIYGDNVHSSQKQNLNYRIARKFGGEKVWQIYLFWAFGKKVWQISQKVIIVSRNLDGFSLVNKEWFVEFVKLSHYTVLCDQVSNNWPCGHIYIFENYQFEIFNVTMGTLFRLSFRHNGTSCVPKELSVVSKPHYKAKQAVW